MPTMNGSNVYIDIFSGCGGLSLGLQNAGWQCLFSIEKNEDAFETYRYNLIKDKNDSWPPWLEISNHDINEVIKKHTKELLELRGKTDLVAGGPPCQGFSTAGKRDKDDKRNGLVESYTEFIHLVKPRFVMFENVVGFTYGFEDKQDGIKHYSQYIIDSLKKDGYSVHAEIVNMFDFGVPQQRKRFILVGDMKGNAEDVFSFMKNNKNTFLKAEHLKASPSVSDAISDLTKSNGVLQSPDSKNFTAGKYGKVSSKYQKYMRVGVDVKSAVDSHRFVKHTNNILKVNEDLLNKAPKGVRILKDNDYVTGLKKRGVTILNPYVPAPTITSIPDELLHYSEPRILTVRECARIQSFPDYFQFKGRYTSGGKNRRKDVPRYTQVANAVPPLFAEQIGLALRRVLKDE